MQSLSKMRTPFAGGLLASSAASASAAPVACESVRCEAQKSFPEWSFRQWLCRVSAPISFYSLPAFNDIIKFHPIFRFAIVAALLCALTASGVQADAQGAQALAAAASSASAVSLASCATLDGAPIDRANTPSLPTPLPIGGGGAGTAAPSSLVFFPQASRSAGGAHWRVWYGNTWKLVENDVTGQQFVLVQRGTEAPSLSAGQNVTLLGSDDSVASVTIRSSARQFTVPVRRLCVEETVSLSFVEMLGERRSVRLLGAVATSPCAFSAGLPGLESSWGDLAKRREQVEANCDLVLGSNAAGPAGEMQNVPFPATLEAELASRADWLRYAAVFFNKEAAANAIHRGILDRYEQTRLAVQHQQTLPPGPRPVVAWISVWSGTFTVSTAAYKADLTAAAGGELFVPADGVLSYSSPAALHVALSSQSVSAIFDETYAFDPTKYSYQDFLDTYGFGPTHNTSTFPFLQRSQVYRQDALLRAEGSALDWFEGAVPNVDVMLADLASLLASLQPSPSAILQRHERVWMRNLAVGEGVRFVSNECSAEEMAAPLTAIGAARAGPENDGVMVAACPVFLTEPWRLLGSDVGEEEPIVWTSTGEGGASSTGADDGAAAHAQVGATAVLMLAAATMHMVAASFGRM